MRFRASIQIIGINPYVDIPADILKVIFKAANKEKGAIPIRGTVNGNPYRQTLVKYSGAWRLYVNTTMLKDSPRRIGETVEITVKFDPEDRSITPHPKLVEAFRANPNANEVFKNLSPSLQKEIVRYIDHLKTEESIDRNITKAILFLLGKGRFVGREKP